MTYDPDILETPGGSRFKLREKEVSLKKDPMTLENSKISLRTLVTALSIGAGVCVSIIGSAIGATWWTSSILNEIRSGQTQSTTKISELTSSLEEVKANSYTLSKASEQALRFALENPGTRVPDPRDPQRIIVVNGRDGH